MPTAAQIKNHRPHILPSIGKATGYLHKRSNLMQDWKLSDKLGDALNAVAPENPSLNPQFFPRIRDQGQIGSCTGHAARSCLLYKILERDKAGVWEKLGFDLSPLALYYWARQLENSVPYDAGAYIIDAVRGATKWGAPREDSHPYVEKDYAKAPSKKALEQGSWHQASGCWKVDELGLTKDQVVDRMLIALSKGLPLDYGWTCFDNLGQADVSGIVPMPNSRSREEGGHSTPAFWADTKSRYFFGPNSWSNQWGRKAPQGARHDERGYIGIPFQFVIDGYLDDIWAVDCE